MRGCILAMCSLAGTLASPIAAQAPLPRVTPSLAPNTAPRAQTAGPSDVRGRVVKPVAGDVQAVAQQWVTLHRVGTDAAGPLDSVRTIADGSYHFRFMRSGAPDAIYFVSSSYGGIAYFTRPLTARVTSGEDGDVIVFDTTSRDVSLTIRGRHVIVATPTAGGMRRVTEVFELSNDSTQTRIASDTTPAGAIWQAPLPRGARAPIVGAGDIPETAVRFEGGRALVYAPFAPGLKQFVVSYSLDDDAFPLSMVTERETSVFEVLVEEPAATVRGPLPEVESVNIEGRHFRRFVATDIAAAQRVTIGVPHPKPAIAPWMIGVLVLGVGGVMTAVLARAVRRR
jgi:hypothetical protein